MYYKSRFMGVRGLTSYICLLCGHKNEVIRTIRQNREELGISSTFLKALSLKSDMLHWSRAKEAFKGGMLISYTLMGVKIMHLHFQSITSILDCYPSGLYTSQTLGLNRRRLAVFRDVRDTYEVLDVTEIKSLL